MLETLKRLYKAGKLTGAMLTRAAALGWITLEQAKEMEEVT